METKKIISGNSEEEVWNQIEADLQSDSDLMQYQAEINYCGSSINLDIDIDFGGGFEGGFELTSFTAKVSAPDQFRFALHHEEFLDEVGKFLGMQDLITGFPEFDSKVVVKTNDIDQLKELFSDHSVRLVFENLEVYRFHLDDGNLVLDIEEGITDTERLKETFSAFYSVLIKLSAS